MDENLYKQILHAVNLTYNPTTPSDQRQQAHQFTEQFKSNESCSDYAFYILSTAAPEHNDILRHFALHCIEHLLQTRWNGLQIEQQLTVRQTVMGLLGNNPKGLLEEPPYIKEKMAGLVSDIAEREFPQRWKEFVQQLMQVWQQGDLQADLSMIVLLNVSQDCKDSDFNAKMPTKRRNEVLKGLNVLLPELLPFTYSYASMQFQRYQQSAPETPEWVAAVSLLSRCLRMLERFLPWNQMEMVAKPEHDYVAVFLGLVSERSVQREALACLKEMCSHKLEDKVFLRLIDSVPTSCTSLMQQQDLIESLPAHKSLAEALSVLLSTNLNKLPKTQEAATYLVFLATVSEHPSLKVTRPPIATWSNVAKDDALSSFEPLKLIVPRILAAYCAKLTKPVVDDDGFFADDLVAEEFSDFVEFKEFNGNFRGAALMMVRAFAEKFPCESLAFLQEMVMHLIQSHGQATDHLDVYGKATRRSEAFRYLEPLSFVIDAIIGSIPKDIYSKQLPDISSRVLALLSVILQWNPNGCILIQLKINSLEAFHNALKYHPDPLLPVIQAFFDAVSYQPDWLPMPDSESTARDLMGEVYAARRLAGQALIRVACSAPAELLPHFPQICARVQEAQARHNRVDTMTMQLYEMLVLISNSAEDMQIRSEFLSQILVNTLSQLTSPELQAQFSGPEALVTQMGVLLQSSPQEEGVVKEKIDWYSNIFVALNTLLNVGKRTGRFASKTIPLHQDATEAELAAHNPFVSIWQQVLPVVLGMLCTIHMLWFPETRDRLAVDQRGREVLAMALEELRLKTSVAGVITMDDQDKMEKAQRRRNLLFLWPVWMTELRNTGYQVIGLACSQRYIYLVDGIVGILQQSLLAGIEHFEHRHLAIFIKQVLCPYILNMPISQYSTLLAPILTPLAVQLLHRFSLAWRPPAAALSTKDAQNQKIYVEGGIYIGHGITDENKEMLIDKLKREATRAYVELIQEMFGMKGELAQAYINLEKEAKPVVGTGTDPATQEFRVGNLVLTRQGQAVKRIHADALSAFLLSHDGQLTEAILMFSVGTLSWADSFCCRRSLKLLQRIVDLTWKNPQFTQFLGGQLFPTCISALLQEPKWLVGMEWDVLSIVQIIYMRFIFGGTGLDKMNGDMREPSDIPRKFMLSLPGITADHITSMEQTVSATNSHKEQKDAIRDLLRFVVTQDTPSENQPTQEKAEVGESVFREKRMAILDLPEQLVINSANLMKQQLCQQQDDGLQKVVDLFDI